MNKVKINLLLAGALMLTVVGCRYPHQVCEMDSKIHFILVNKNGVENELEEYAFTGHTYLALYDQLTGELYSPHFHKIEEGYLRYYLSPDICDKTFPSVRGILECDFVNNADGKEYYIADTIDAELEYLATDKCYLKSYSLNGVPQWYRDTCTTDYYRSTRICTIVIDSSRFIEKKPL